MRVFREIDAGQKSPVRPEEKLPSIEMENRWRGPRYTPEEYHRLRRSGRMHRQWRQYYILAALVLICSGILYLAFFSETKTQVSGPLPLEESSASVPEESSQGEMAAVGEGLAAAQKVRVLLSAPEGGYIHRRLEIECGENAWLEEGMQVQALASGEKLILEGGVWNYGLDTIRLSSTGQEACFTILSMTNALGDAPVYRGSMEITRCEGGYQIINEVYLEQYLYSVITSEMPESFGLEALKAQAVCARSYALKRCGQGLYAQYGADLDDSVSSQTYNDWPETELAVQAVEGTRGVVLEEDGEIISANYFSTSCGMRADYADAWLVGTGIAGPACLMGGREYTAPEYGDLSVEENFRRFIADDGIEALEADAAWFRWSVTIPAAELENQISVVLAGLGSAYVTQLNGAGTEFVEDDGAGIGDLQAVYVYDRASSGLIRSVLLQGSMKTVKVTGEYNIRRLLAPTDSTLVKTDGSTENKMSALPSAFWYADHQMGEDGTLISVTFYGGGYGHGVGMSQVGAARLAAQGQDYEQILRHYYSGVTLGRIG